MSSIYLYDLNSHGVFVRGPFCNSRIDPRRKVSQGTSGILNTKRGAHLMTFLGQLRAGGLPERPIFPSAKACREGASWLNSSLLKPKEKFQVVFDWVSINVRLPHCNIQWKTNFIVKS